MICTCCQPINGARVMCSMAHSITDQAGRKWHFEWHPMFGPTVLTAQGAARVRQPGVKSAFWDAFEAWEKTAGGKP